jgi:hypothetical protein
MSALDDVEAQIVADLNATQGPWRARPAAVRIALLVVPAVAVVIVATLALSANRGVDASVVSAAVAGLVALLAVALAPERPALSERVAQGAALLSVGAFGVELLHMHEGGASGAAACAAIVVVVALVAAGALAAALFASRLPLRPWHRVGLATAAALGASSGVWHHCASHEMWHVLLAHAAVPVVVMGAVAAGLGLRRAPN